MAANTYTQVANATFGPDDEVTDTYTYERFKLGSYREESGKGYRFVKKDSGATAAAVGNLAYFTATSWNVTATAANTASGLECGVWVSVIPASNWGWIQVYGPVTLNTSGVDDIAAGDGLIGAATAAGTVRRVVSPGGGDEAHILATGLLAVNSFGVAVAADSDGANTVAAFVSFRFK